MEMSHWVYPGLKKVGVKISTTSKLEKITKTCSTYFRQDVNDVLGTSSRANVMPPRQIAMWVATYKYGFKLTDVGKHFSRDHSTVIHARQKTFDLMQFDKEYKRKVSEILELLTLN